MWVCHCNGITDGEILDTARTASDAEEVARRCGAGTACGGCRPEVRRLCATLGLPSVPSTHADLLELLYAG